MSKHTNLEQIPVAVTLPGGTTLSLSNAYEALGDLRGKELPLGSDFNPRMQTPVLESKRVGDIFFLGVYELTNSHDTFAYAWDLSIRTDIQVYLLKPGMVSRVMRALYDAHSLTSDQTFNKKLLERFTISDFVKMSYRYGYPKPSERMVGL